MAFKMKILEEDKNHYEDLVINTKKENKQMERELLTLYQDKNNNKEQRVYNQNFDIANNNINKLEDYKRP